MLNIFLKIFVPLLFYPTILGYIWVVYILWQKFGPKKEKFWRESANGKILRMFFLEHELQDIIENPLCREITEDDREKARELLYIVESLSFNSEFISLEQQSKCDKFKQIETNTLRFISFNY
jgi:hypothetical protein